MDNDKDVNRHMFPGGRDANTLGKAGIRVLFCMIACVALAARCLMAHDPHDPIFTVAISPNYANDQTVFASTGDLSLKIDVVALFKSTDGGVTFSPVAGLPKDTTLLTIAFSPGYSQDQTIYIAGSQGGLFRSTDQGTSWSTLVGQSIEFVTLSPNFVNDNTLFVLTANKTILKSTNRGDTWTSVPAPASLTSGLHSMAVSPNYVADHTLLLGTAADGIFKSGNAGASWLNVTSGRTLPTVEVLAFSPNFSSDQTAFAATFGSGVLVSTNKGNSWTASNSGITDLNVTSLALSPNYAQNSTLWVTAAAGGVFQSASSGAAWNPGVTVQRVPSSLTTVHYKALASGLSSSGVALYLGMYEGLWISSNSGSSWRYIDTLPTRLIRYINVSPNFAQDQTVFASTYGSGNLWSTTGGASWYFSNTGMQLPYTDASAISPNYAADGIAFSSNDAGLERTSTRGKIWQLMAGIGVSCYPRAVAVSPAFAQDSEVLIGLATTSTGAGVPPPAKQPNTGVYRSTDGGNTFVTTSLSGITGIYSIAMSPAFSSDRTAFAASQSNGLYKSTDSGITWTAVATLPTKALGIVAISPSFATDGTLFAAGIPGGVYKSTDRGSTWSTLSGTDSLRVLNLQISPNYTVDQSLFAGTVQRGLMRFTKGGATIFPVYSFPDNFVTAIGLSPNFANDNTLFAAGYHGLFKSTDAGSTWTNTGAPARIEESQNIAGPLDEPPIITYQGSWLDVVPSAYASSNAYMQTNTSQDALVLNFLGTGIGWVTLTGPHQGTAAIQLDGVSQGTVSLHAPVDSYQQLVWQTQGLVCGLHTLSITAQPQSGQSVSLDAFNVWVNNCPQQ